ncbi:MAG: hypothetical protein PHS41_09440 [Victivallaceae bacterium]|nr:hypothetical protein [Victivallaceae bacterium]
MSRPVCKKSVLRGEIDFAVQIMQYLITGNKICGLLRQFPQDLFGARLTARQTAKKNNGNDQRSSQNKKRQREPFKMNILNNRLSYISGDSYGVEIHSFFPPFRVLRPENREISAALPG